jgi:hypothetical protein
MRGRARGGIVAGVPTDHHSEYLARAVAALTPEGHQRVDVLLDQLAGAVADRQWLVRFASTRQAEADLGRVAVVEERGAVMTAAERDALIAGFMAIRDQEPLDDVANWAGAVVALLEDI